MQKETIRVLAYNQPQLPVPTLALNHLETPAFTGNLYQFGLSPEDEVKEIATRAWTNGHKSPLILAPDGSWGEGIARAFQNEWEKLGEQLTTPPIIYSGNYQSEVPEELRKVGPTDMAFMVALPQMEMAQKIRHFLTLALGNNLPIYSISRVYGGTPNPKRDAGLEGVKFVNMPWVLAPDKKAVQLQRTLQQQYGQDNMDKYNWLYALGVEAYHLLAKLQGLSSHQWQGQTGHLSINNMGEIHRDQLPWAHFVGGKVRINK